MTLRAIILLSALGALFAAIGSLFGTVEASIALSAAVIIAFWSYWAAAPLMLIRLAAVPCRDAAILQMVAVLSARAGLPAPQVYMISERQPNAMAIGPNPHAASIILTNGLCEMLRGDEVRAVLAHEIVHIRNRDILVRTIATTFVQAISSLALLVGLLGFVTRRRGSGMIILVAILAPLIGLVLQLAMIRSSEYRADHDACLLCGNYSELISALQKLAVFADRIENASIILQPTAAPAFIVDPVPQSWLSAIFSMHPPIAKRIARLQKQQLKFVH